jgi:hypothetical protein
LAGKNVGTVAPYQEDWGWELPATYGRDSYYLCISGNADTARNDEGEWGIIVERRRSIWERLRGTGKIADDDAVVRFLEQILSDDPQIRDVHREVNY